ncbi:hypothetical protein P3S67_002918 [Capsicum chacoense]
MVTTRSSFQQAAATSSPTLKGWLTFEKKYRKVSGIYVNAAAPGTAPAVVLSLPASPTGSNGDTSSRVSTSTNAPELVPPPHVPPTGSDEAIPKRVLMSCSNAPKLVPQPPMPPLGSTSDRPLLIPCNEEDEQKETKFKLNPLSRLKAAKETHVSANGFSSQVHEKSQKVITDEVKSMLVTQLTSEKTTSADEMVTFANRTFTTLNWFGADYALLHKDVKDFIAYKFDLLTAERKLDMLAIPELENKNLDIVICANDIEESIEQAQANQKMAKEKKEPLKRQIEDEIELIEDARKRIRRLEREIAHIEQDEKLIQC